MCIRLSSQNLIPNGSKKIFPIIPVRSVFRTRFLITFSLPRLLLAALFGLLAAQFPDDAALAKFAVDTRVGAGPAIVQAFLTVTDFHFLADDTAVPVRVMAAFIHKFHRHIIAKS
jgi:hypothetical protein